MSVVFGDNTIPTLSSVVLLKNGVDIDFSVGIAGLESNAIASSTPVGNIEIEYGDKITYRIDPGSGGGSFLLNSITLQLVGA
jgi:hypothetical protein